MQKKKENNNKDHLVQPAGRNMKWQNKNNNALMKKVIKTTINHQSKKGYSWKNKKEQSTCAKQKE